MSRLTADRSHFLRRSALASVCLLLVAGLHLYGVWNYRQTPWKGGGFGMFSTVDSENARYLRVTLTLEGEEHRVRVPDSLAKRAAVLRAAPTEATAFELADKLRALRWRRRGEYWAAVAAELPRERSVTANDLRQPIGSAEALQPGQGSDWEPVTAGEPGVKVTAARVEVLRHRFDAANSELRAEPIFVVSRAGTP